MGSPPLEMAENKIHGFYWGYFTLLIGGITPFITIVGAHLVLITGVFGKHLLKSFPGK